MRKKTIIKLSSSGYSRLGNEPWRAHKGSRKLTTKKFKNYARSKTLIDNSVNEKAYRCGFFSYLKYIQKIKLLFNTDGLGS